MRKRRKSLSTLSQVNSVLGKMSKRSEVGNLEEGKEYICPTCNLPVKPCEEHSANTCPTMIKGETEIDHLEQIEMRRSRGEEVCCINCGTVIPKRQLQRNPLREICGTCLTAVNRKRAAK